VDLTIAALVLGFTKCFRKTTELW